MAQLAKSPGAPVGRPINLIPVGLKEAAIDSPTSRASVVHYAEQVDLIEKWLEDYMKSTHRLVSEATTLENSLNLFASHAVLPAAISETMIDHDYTLLAMRKYSENARDFWTSTVRVVKRLNTVVIEPIRTFLQNDLRTFKDTRRVLEHAQKTFDSTQIKYAALGKNKEPSFLREEAFQLHEARKAYLKSCMDFFSLAPQLRFSLDRLIIRVFTVQWREMKNSCDGAAASLQRNTQEMDRIQGWVREIENSENFFRKELVTARKQLEDAAESVHRPSRELEDYASTTSHMSAPGAGGFPRSPRKAAASSAEKQGWLFLRTYTGRPTRVVYLKRWAFIRNGIFGWLVQDNRNGGVDESERIGVLLCSARPAPVEERRFCFEIKTNKHTIILQAESQSELVSWIGTFESAKTKALDDPGATDDITNPGQHCPDPAFSISPPSIPEFSTSILALLEPGASEDSSVDRSGILSPSILDSTRESTDASRRPGTLGSEEGGREHTSRIMAKFDAKRKSSAHSQFSGPPTTPNAGGGIASLIAASHGSMPVGPALPMMSQEPELLRSRPSFTLALRDMPQSSLAPAALASPPAPTNMSRTAVVVTGERGLSASRDKIGLPDGLLANTWGSSTSVVNRLENGDLNVVQSVQSLATPSLSVFPTRQGSLARGLALFTENEAADIPSMSSLDLSGPRSLLRSRTPSPEKVHRNTISLDGDAVKQIRAAIGVPDFPNYYPMQLKTQDAQFRLLFPTVRQEERLVLVFRASWAPSEEQEFPGRVYVTTKEIYFYGHHLGLVLTSGVSLSSVDEVTAAPGREGDYLFLHMLKGRTDSSPSRIQIKTFLEPLRLLQRRLNFLVKNSAADVPSRLEDVIKALLRLESEVSDRPPSLESWEDVGPNPSADRGAQSRARASTTGAELRSSIHVDRTLGNQANNSNSVQEQKMTKFKLPAHPVIYTPPGNLRLAVDRLFDVSPKAMFHVLFGDRSAVWQLLQHERRAQNLRQGPWVDMGEGRMRRDFGYSVTTTDSLGHERITDVRDYQVVDVNNDHLCYVVTDKRTAWHLPCRRMFRLVSKVVITHVAKGRCKLAIFVKVEWLRSPWMLMKTIEHHAITDLELDALDLADLAADQVGRLGPHSRTKKAIQIFGLLGQSKDVTQLEIDHSTLHVEMRRVPVARTAFGLVWHGMAAATETAAGTLLETMCDVLKWVWKTGNANVVILGLLVVSALFNGWYSSRDGLLWWHERNASRFLGRIGVSSNQVMSKAVSLSNLEEMVDQDRVLPHRGSNACYSVFHDEYRLDSVDAPPYISRTIQRTQETRQKLGHYRHDLLVAMRIINTVENELVLSAWEQWTADESRRCQAVEGLLDQVTQMNSTEVDVHHADEVKRWYEEYCVSCHIEHEKVKKGTTMVR